MNLTLALRTSSSPRLALVGAGGKTTALYQLARQLAPALVTTTTHLGAWQAELADRQLRLAPGEAVPDIRELCPSGVTLVSGPILNDRCAAPDPVQLALLGEACQTRGLPLLIEADGARGWPLKAPAGYEPVIPEFVDHVLVVAGLSGLGKALAEGNVHRPEIFSRLSGLQPGAPVSPAGLSRVLSHPEGGLKNIPTGARRAVLLNQAETPELLSTGGQMAEGLLGAYQTIVVGSLTRAELQVFESVAAVILAGGQARRYGGTKQLLEWHGRPLVRHAAETALSAGLSPVVVVSGAESERVEAAVRDLPVEIAHNPDWQVGQSGSLQVGLTCLPTAVGAAIFLLADQPQVTPSLLRALVGRHRRDLPAIVAPLVGERRANPVLFDRVTFPALMQLTGDIGGRAIFSKYPVENLPWLEEGLLMDIDTPEDYRRALDCS